MSLTTDNAENILESARLTSLRAGRVMKLEHKRRMLYPRTDSAAQLPPPKGHRRPEFCRPLRQVEIRVRGRKLVDATAWGFANINETSSTEVTPNNDN